MSIGFLVLLLLAFGLGVSVHGQSQTGFISIDCGAPENFNYVDIDTGISYTSDGSFINTGTNKNISSEYAYPNNPTLPQPLSDLRAFPEGKKNCYTLRPADGKGNLYLIRAYFLYGNYDGENKLPEFDLYLDVNLWFSVKLKNASDMVTTEIISVAASDTIHICLVNVGLGTPFISGLELRPLNGSIYNIESGTSGSLVLFDRWDTGYRNGSGRYNDDIYDRMWSSYSSSSWESITTSSAIDVNGNGYKVPLEVMRTAGRPVNGSHSLELYWTTPDVNSRFYFYMHFAEVEILTRNQSREFNVFWNGTPLFGPFAPRYLYAATMSNSNALVGKEHRISINRTANSTLPPLLNAVELFMFKKSIELPTYDEDVDAINNVKSTYGVNKNWVGDPCGPKNYSWEGLKCNFSDSNPPRIISINLSSSSLSGGIDVSIANLSSLETLDLSHNGLSGPVPQFLGELSNLKFLNLENNNLSGSIPATLLEKSKAGLLTLLADSQNLCISDSCKKKKKKKNIIVPTVASVSSTLVLIMVLMITWRIRREEKPGSNEEGRSLESKKRKFTFSEVTSMTNNFERALGKGGFGTVYLGFLKDGTQVAVKLLSSTSSQGSKEFRTEAELLMRVHHRNLAPFVGYCDDNNNNLALVYDYMANGNLKDYLSDNTHTLSWEVRLRIAIDAAQGLEYLHHGCKPPIIHRDVKSANILLSENLDAKIADFGLSKVIPGDGQSHVSTTVMGTTGYLDPEYYIFQKLTEKSDVYSFGIVMLELITGQPAIIKTGDPIHIVQWVIPMIERGEIRSIVDLRLQGDYEVNSVWKALEVAMACTAPTSLRRATMSFVLAELKESLAMELANKREKKAKKEVMSIQHSNNSTEVFSGDVDSMTGPLAR